MWLLKTEMQNKKKKERKELKCAINKLYNRTFVRMRHFTMANTFIEFLPGDPFLAY